MGISPTKNMSMLAREQQAIRNVSRLADQIIECVLCISLLQQFIVTFRQAAETRASIEGQNSYLMQANSKLEQMTSASLEIDLD
jgi:hypothetical protein